MSVVRLETVDAFVVIDLDHDGSSMGVVRSAPKVLVDGATWLARSQTYQFASFELQMSGASAGINAPAAGRDDAVAAFVAEMAARPDAGRVLLDAGRGVSPADLAGLRAVDVRSALYHHHHDELWALGVAVSADSGLDGGLDGRAVAIEGFGPASPSLAEALEARGARITAVSTSVGAVLSPAGLASSALAEAWAEHGAEMPAALDGEHGEAGLLFGAEVDVLLVGSKAGVLDHEVASRVAARTVVPSGPIPVSAKALAVLRRSGTVVLPDFITCAGPLLAAFAPEDRTLADARDAVERRVAGALDEVRGHGQGPLLGACLRAEAFLATWCSALPFGRPLA